MGDICCTSLESSSFLNWKINLRNTGKKKYQTFGHGIIMIINFKNIHEKLLYDEIT